MLPVLSSFRSLSFFFAEFLSKANCLPMYKYSFLFFSSSPALQFFSTPTFNFCSSYPTGGRRVVWYTYSTYMWRSKLPFPDKKWSTQPWCGIFLDYKYFFTLVASVLNNAFDCVFTIKFMFQHSRFRMFKFQIVNTTQLQGEPHLPNLLYPNNTVHTACKRHY